MTKLDQKTKRHKEIVTELNTLYDQKNRDYDDSFGKSFTTYGMAMPCIRLEDKLNRLRALTLKNQSQQVQDESVIDTLKDLANYAIMTIIEMEMQEDEQRSDM